ncbi:MAG: DUF4430 domain-containing protein [Bdellovibrio sp.]|nr:DUF4430 domain-containing protein [Bdellovibrio sp.]
MKNIIALFAVLLPLSSHALTWKVVGPCSETPLYEGTVQADLKKTAGALTIEIFEAAKVPYYGVEEGISSINDSPVGLDAMEVISDTEMRAYGWCYSINGQVPLAMPHKTFIKSQDDTLVWFYGYSTNKNNQWLDMCMPGFKIKAKQFCQK